jgi:hypothetical protein
MAIYPVLVAPPQINRHRRSPAEIEHGKLGPIPMYRWSDMAAVIAATGTAAADSKLIPDGILATELAVAMKNS